MEFRILGPLQVSDAGQAIALGGPKQRLILALLLLEANRLVPLDRLLDRVWGEDPPDAAKASLQAYISRLRKQLGPGRIAAGTPGYTLRAEPAEIDALVFERLIGEAHRRLGEDPQAARAQLDQALALWRGPALADLVDEPGLQPEITRLDEMRLAALEDRAEADLALGRQAELIPDLERDLAENRLRERLWAALMLALYRAGRQADALGAYQRARRVLREELGIDPSPELQRLQERILKQDPDLDLRGRRLRGYELIERIGEGAFGVVHRAYQAGVGRDVAIKVIHRRLANEPGFIRRFEQEARLVARLEHPHIVPLYDYWREPDGAYLAMRYLRGGSLKDLIAKQGPLPGDAAALVMDQVAAAVAAAHRQGVIHRDVRPANILFDEEGNAYLTDFGIAKEVATGGALNRRAGGLAFYLAPEEIRHEAISPATDVYSLGLVLYEMLAGEHPFGDTPPSEVRDRHLRATVPPIDHVRPDLPVAVSAVIQRAVAKEAADRYGDAPDLAAALRAAIAGTASTAPAGVADQRNPYKGLRPFEEGDAADFFGRADDVAHLVSRLAGTGSAARFVAVVGPSGTGKSSLVSAGLIPALRAGLVPGSERWFIVQMHAGSHPFAELESALLTVAVRRPPGLLDELERDRLGMTRAIEWILPSDRSDLLIVIDQFEELYTLVADERERDAFMDSLAATVSAPGSRARIVITLRADFYDRPLLQEPIGRLVGDGTIPLTVMGASELERAVTGPAERVGVSVDPRLVAEILTDVRHQAGSLPLLQFALTEAFQERDGATMTVETYRATGGVLGALSRRAEAIYERLDTDGRETCRQVFLRLVTLGEEGAEDTRRRALRSDLLTIGGDPGAVERLVDLLGSRRLLSFDRDTVTRSPTVELAHEALLGEWPRLREWVAAARDDLKVSQRLVNDARQWDGNGRDPSFLLRGFRLEQSEAWSARSVIAPTDLELAYIHASQDERSEEHAAEEAQRLREAALQKRGVQRLRALVAVLIAGVLAVGGLAAVAADRSRQAERAAALATARELAAAAVAQLGKDTKESLRLALASADATRQVDGSVLPEVEEALHAALSADRLVTTMPGAAARFSADGKRLLLVGPGAAVFETHAADTWELLVRHEVGHAGDPTFEGRIEGFSHDGQTFVAALREDGDEFTVGFETATGNRIWKLPTCCNSIVVSPDDRSFTVYGGPEQTNLHDLATGRLINTYGGFGPFAFAPDGEHGVLLVDNWSDERDDPVAGLVGFVYEPRGGATTELRGSGAGLGLAEWSPDGSTLAAATSTTVTLWDPITGEPRFSFSPGSGGITSLAFGPDSKRIATGLNNGTTVVWDLAANGALDSLTLAGHGGPVQTVSFDPTGARLATSGADNEVKVWDLSPATHREWVAIPCSHALAYSNNGRYLACGLDSGDIVLHDAATGQPVRTLRGHTGPVAVLQFTPDDAVLISAALDLPEVPSASARAWDTTSGVEAYRVSFDGSAIGDIELSPDGMLFGVAEKSAEGPSSGGSSLYRVATGERIGTLPASNGVDGYQPNIALAFSPDGTLIAGASFSGVFVWSLGETRQLHVSVQWETNAIAWSPNGDRLVVVSSSDDSGITVWDPTTGTRLEVLAGTIGDVNDVAFSRDGSRMATSSSDGTIRLWHGDRLEQLFTLATDASGDLCFSPNGTRLAYTASDGMVRVLALDVDELLDLARARLSKF